MGRSKINGTTKKAAIKYEKLHQIASRAVDSINANLPGGDFSAVDQIFNDIGNLDADYSEAASLVKLAEARLEELAMNATEANFYVFESHIDYLRKKAKEYFIERIFRETKDNHVADILYWAEQQLENRSISPYFRAAVTDIKEWSEIKIERLRKRNKILKDLDTGDSKHAKPLIPSTAKSDITQGMCERCGKGEVYSHRNIEVVTLLMVDILETLNEKLGLSRVSTESLANEIAFITGYSRNTTKRVINSPYRKEDAYNEAYKKDCSVRKNRLKNLGLHELAKKIP